MQVERAVTQRTLTLPCRSVYVTIKLELPEQPEVVLQQGIFRDALRSALRSAFGTVGGLTGVQLQLVHYDELAATGVVKVDSKCAGLVRNACTLLTQLGGHAARLQVVRQGCCTLLPPPVPGE